MTRVVGSKKKVSLLDSCIADYLTSLSRRDDRREEVLRRREAEEGRPLGKMFAPDNHLPIVGDDPLVDWEAM